MFNDSKKLYFLDGIMKAAVLMAIVMMGLGVAAVLYEQFAMAVISFVLMLVLWIVGWIAAEWMDRIRSMHIEKARRTWEMLRMATLK